MTCIRIFHVCKQTCLDLSELKVIRIVCVHCTNQHYRSFILNESLSITKEKKTTILGNVQSLSRNPSYLSNIIYIYTYIYTRTHTHTLKTEMSTHMLTVIDLKTSIHQYYH